MKRNRLSYLTKKGDAQVQSSPVQPQQEALQADLTHALDIEVSHPVLF